MRLIGLVVVLTLSLVLAPLAVEAQSAGKVARLGVLSPTSPSPVQAFLDALRDLGWAEGQNLTVEWRWAGGKFDRLPSLAAELADLKVDVIAAATPPAILAAKRATTTIPIVMIYGGDPVELGFVASLARPGGNVTGVASLSAELNGKQLQLLKELVPTLTRVAILLNPANPWHASGSKELGVAAASLGLRLQLLEVRDPDEFDAAFAAMTAGRSGAIVVLSDPMFFVHRTRLADLAVKHRLPTMHGVIEFAGAGGLMAYYPSSADQYRRAATYIDKVLKGAKPSDLPVDRPERLTLAINLKTAKALGLTIPQTILLQADQVIE